MKVLCYGDVHWSQYSSIMRSRDKYYSTRLDNLIRSVNWAEEQAAYQGCDAIVILGDFFDSSHISAEEASALKEIRWAPCSHVIITGNHETTVSNLEYSTADLLSLCPNATVISSPELFNIEGTNCEFCFLPYILERDRKPLQEYFPKHSYDKSRIIFSHNDIKDINYGNFISPEGFALDDIETNCDLFLNGHIHHASRHGDTLVNVGNLTGQNFTEDINYIHGVCVINTDGLSVEWVNNPYAIYFHKLDLTSINDAATFTSIIGNISKNIVLTIKVSEDFALTAKQLLHQYMQPNIIEHRIIVDRSKTLDHSQIEIEAIDHLQQFENYVLSNIGDTQIIKEELAALFS